MNGTRPLAVVAAVLAAVAGTLLTAATALAAAPGAPPPPPSRIESLMPWLPAVSIGTVVGMVALEVAQSLPEATRARRFASEWAVDLAFAAAVIIVLNAVRAADIVGFI